MVFEVEIIVIENSKSKRVNDNKAHQKQNNSNTSSQQEYQQS